MASVLKVDKLDPQSGTALEIGTSGDTVSIPSGATLDISSATLTPPATMPASSGVNLTALNATNLGSGTVPTARLGTGTASSSTILYGDNTWAAAAGGNDGLPYFWASRILDQSITDATETKVEMDNEVLDSGSCYDDSTNYRWTPNVAGKFFIFAQVYTVGNVADNMNDAYAQLKKNGSAIAPYIETIPNANGRGWPQQLSTIVDMNGTDDYLEIYGYMNTSTGNAYFGSAADPNNKTYWWGYRIAT